MNPAYSVILLTTLIGAGQGLFLALLARPRRLADVARRPRLLLQAGSVALLLTAAGLLASFFHLGHPSAPGDPPRSGAPPGCRAR
jgi:DMSO reductase anchor subunit